MNKVKFKVIRAGQLFSHSKVSRQKEIACGNHKKYNDVNNFAFAFSVIEDMQTDGGKQSYFKLNKKNLELCNKFESEGGRDDQSDDERGSANPTTDVRS
ncbi:unnamed protein product [Rodentolepis nana]|uniref:SBDS domain-containing protein n=1 Tax=Rodentolepis nana TaxID=102285 RepID=A0A0R3TFE6_RODNA|nr:unnamed protein product [Rodentolepis nana]